MQKVNLLKYFRTFTNSSHQIAAVNMLQNLLDPELLDKNSDWVVCFDAENESDPQPANYNV